MKKIFYLILASFLLVSCVSQSKYDKLEEENKKLKEENEIQFARIALLTSKVEELENEKIQVEIEKNKTKWYSEKQAMDYLKDYYEFYLRDLKFKDAKIRRTADNEFLISLTECLKEIDHCYAKVWTLTINKDGTYTMNY